MVRGHGVILLAMFIAIIVGGVVAKHILEGTSGVVSARTHEAEVVKLINKYRIAHHLHILTPSNALHASALEHSQDMVANSYFDHRGFPERVRRHRNATLVGENIAYGGGQYGTPSGTLTLWKNSPPHNKVLLTAKFRRVGVGVVIGVFLGTSDAVVTTANFSS